MRSLRQPLELVGLSAILLLTTPAIATAQSTPELFQRNAQANDSTTLSASTSNSETLYLAPNETVAQDLRLDTAATINGRDIPAGSVIRGQFEPVNGGLRYVANSAEVGDRIYSFSAASDTLHDVKDPRETSTGAILGDAAIGAAGGALLGEIFGNADILEVVGGAAAGVVVGNVTAQRVVIVEPTEALTLQIP
ncbi:MAG: hypothetical protein AAF215_20400 [Cyanobacteria bacterium P01_A01_bin.123]